MKQKKRVAHHEKEDKVSTWETLTLSAAPRPRRRPLRSFHRVSSSSRAPSARPFARAPRQMLTAMLNRRNETEAARLAAQGGVPLAMHKSDDAAASNAKRKEMLGDIKRKLK